MYIHLTLGGEGCHWSDMRRARHTRPRWKRRVYAVRHHKLRCALARLSDFKFNCCYFL